MPDPTASTWQQLRDDARAAIERGEPMALVLGIYGDVVTVEELTAWRDEPEQGNRSGAN